MKRRSFLQNKLWRDKAVDLLEEMGSIIHWRSLDDADYDEQLRVKLVEEALEVQKATSLHELKQELADVLEVLDAICEIHGISWEEAREVQSQKRRSRGGFKDRKFVTVASHLADSFGERYCLADPGKYPEITTEEED